MVAARLRSLTTASTLLSSVCGLPNTIQAGSEIDREHIFGFTEGTDIGAKGEIELVNTATAARYEISDRVPLSAGTLFDFHSINNVPGLDTIPHSTSLA